MNSIKYYWDKFRFYLKRNFVQVVKSNTSDRSIAWGYALGTFVAVLPTPGISTLIGLGLIAVFKKINKISVFIAMAVWNAFTVLPMYWLSHKIGHFLFNEESAFHFKLELLDQAYQYIRRFLIGNLFVSIPLAIFSFYFALFLVRKFRTIRKFRIKKRTAKVFKRAG